MSSPQTSVARLYAANATTLREGLVLLQSLTPETFQKDCDPAFLSTISAHYRHLIEHYHCFSSQCENGVVCYDDRQRDQRLETNYDYAVQSLQSLVKEMEQLALNSESRLCSLAELQIDGTVDTSVERELLFLQSHTMHHYAIIGAMCRLLGLEVPADFGVAIATRVHIAESKSEPSLLRSASCAR